MTCIGKREVIRASATVVSALEKSYKPCCRVSILTEALIHAMSAHLLSEKPSEDELKNMIGEHFCEMANDTYNAFHRFGGNQPRN